MRKMLKMIACAALALLVMQGPGCQGARELSDLVIVMGLGMDSDAKNQENMKLTAQIVLPEKISSSQGNGGSSSNSQGPYYNLDISAPNTFEAVRGYTHMVSGRLYIAHTQVFVIGRAVAQEGIAPHLDFFTRAKETRPTAKIVIAETTASEALSIKPPTETLPAIYIAELIDGQTFNSQSKVATMLDYVKAMQSPTASLVVPILHIEENEGNQMLAVSGMAVFKEDKMVGELSKEETRGLLWVLGDVRSTVVNVEIAGGIASFDVLNAKSNVSPILVDDKVVMKIDVVVSVKLVEQTCKENLANPESIKELQSLAEEVIRGEIMLAYYKAASLQADVFDFGGLIHQRDKASWHKMEADWDRLFSAITLDISTDISIKSTGPLEKPAWEKPKEEVRSEGQG